MEDDLELNFATPSGGASAALIRRQTTQKGGRWTDRYVLRPLSGVRADGQSYG